jgi:hypothetical protein
MAVDGRDVRPEDMSPRPARTEHGHPAQRGDHRRRCRHLSSRLRPRPRRHRLDAHRLAIRQRPNARMAEDEEPKFRAELEPRTRRYAAFGASSARSTRPNVWAAASMIRVLGSDAPASAGASYHLSNAPRTGGAVGDFIHLQLRPTSCSGSASTSLRHGYPTKNACASRRRWSSPPSNCVRHSRAKILSGRSALTGQLHAWRGACKP